MQSDKLESSTEGQREKEKEGERRGRGGMTAAWKTDRNKTKKGKNRQDKEEKSQSIVRKR